MPTFMAVNILQEDSRPSDRVRNALLPVFGVHGTSYPLSLSENDAPAFNSTRLWDQADDLARKRRRLARGFDETAAKKARDEQWLRMQERVAGGKDAEDLGDVTVICVEGKAYVAQDGDVMHFRFNV